MLANHSCRVHKKTEKFEIALNVAKRPKIRSFFNKYRLLSTYVVEWEKQLRDVCITTSQQNWAEITKVNVQSGTKPMGSTKRRFEYVQWRKRTSVSQSYHSAIVSDPWEELRRYPQRKDGHQIFIISVSYIDWTYNWYLDYVHWNFCPKLGRREC